MSSFSSALCLFAAVRSRAATSELIRPQIRWPSSALAAHIATACKRSRALCPAPTTACANPLWHNPRLLADPQPYRRNPFLRGPCRLQVAFDGVRQRRGSVVTGSSSPDAERRAARREGRHHLLQILSLDGGLKGLFSAAVLAEIESDHRVQIAEHFDLIVGTSTGGLIALALG